MCCHVFQMLVHQIGNQAWSWSSWTSQEPSPTCVSSSRSVREAQLPHTILMFCAIQKMCLHYENSCFHAEWFSGSTAPICRGTEPVRGSQIWSTLVVTEPERCLCEKGHTWNAVTGVTFWWRTVCATLITQTRCWYEATTGCICMLRMMHSNFTWVWSHKCARRINEVLDTIIETQSGFEEQPHL